MKNTNTTKKVLFSTDWFEDEQYEDNFDEDNFETCLDDTRRELSDLYPSYDKICVVADLGLWNGRQNGYKIIDTDEILYSDCDYATWYVEDGDLKFDGSHHDGNNHYVYYGIKDIYEFEDDVDEHGLTDEVIKKHLVSIGDEVEKLCYL